MSQPTLFIGVDPGLSGAIACIYPTGTIELSDTPTVAITRGKKNARDYDPVWMATILVGSRATAKELGWGVHVGIERQQAFPPDKSGKSQGVASSFRVGYGYGLWLGILVGLRLPYTEIHPRTWKAKIMRDMGKDKGASILRAKAMFPQAAGQLTLKKHDGRAEALLVAAYLRQENNHG